ncbi:MAG: hypothetical protein ABSA74_02755 [Candidatus Staskawiczbacteria bacterium]|jgi:uncharacterized membrane protein (DUF485 family)
MNKKKIFLILSGALLLPLLASAQTVQTMADSAATAALYVASGIIVILWVLTGVLFLMAQGEPATLNKAKLALLASVIGTIVIIIANMTGGPQSIVHSIFGI